MILRRSNIRYSIMAVGAKGSGKSSFFNNIIGRNIAVNKQSEEIDIYMLNVDCEGVMQKITLIDTPGLGYSVNDEGIQESIINYIKEQFDSFIEEETKIRRNPKYEDSRVHCMLYFIPATSKGLKQRDIEFLQQVSSLVNVIPIISKADALTENEVHKMKEYIKDQLEYFKIKVFNLENEDYISRSISELSLNSNIPFTSICLANANEDIRVKTHYAGTIEIDNPKNSDLSILREILLSSHLEALMDSTSSELYEKYRAETLESVVKD